MALVAAMRPKSYGSSTIGMKKSVVATSACSSLSRYTAASSDVSTPTSSSGGTGMRALVRRISESNAGAILQPQPPPCDNDVSRGWGEVASTVAKEPSDGGSIESPWCRSTGGQQAHDQPRQGALLAARFKPGRTLPALAPKRRQQAGLVATPLQQRCQRAFIPAREIAGIVGSQHTDVPRYARSQHRGAGTDRLQHRVRAALDRTGVDHQVGSLDPAQRVRVRQCAEPAVPRARARGRAGP